MNRALYVIKSFGCPTVECIVSIEQSYEGASIDREVSQRPNPSM
jgi:hypothetical protein